MNEIIHLEEQYEFYKNDPEFCAELDDLLKIMQEDRRCYIMRRK